MIRFFIFLFIPIVCLQFKSDAESLSQKLTDIGYSDNFMFSQPSHMRNSIPLITEIIEPRNDIYINSKNIFYNKTLDTIELGKNSFINNKNTSIKTNNAIIDNSTKEILIDGEFFLSDSKDILKGTYLKSDLDYTNAYSENINYVVDNDIKINAKSLTKKNNLVTFKDSFITPCDLKGVFNCPTWSLKVKKTNYNIDDDQFRHFSTFVQIADQKVAYLPYFSHYGSKAERKMGFLTPSIQPINLSLGSNITTPFYVPLKESSDVVITPTFYYSKYLTKYITNVIQYNSVKTSGSNDINIDTYFDSRAKDQSTFGGTIQINSSRVINKNNKLNVSLSNTTNISRYKSQTDSNAGSLDSSISLETYNLTKKNDVMLSSFTATKSLDSTSSDKINPYDFSIKYYDYQNLTNEIGMYNDYGLSIVTREQSADFLPNQLVRLGMNNSFDKNLLVGNYYRLANKVKLSSNFLSANSNNDTSNLETGSTLGLGQYFSSELNKLFKLNNNYRVKPRIKAIFSNTHFSKNLKVNDNSQTLSFNYNNLFEENRLFGSDKMEKSYRLAFGLEQSYELKKGIDKIQIDIGKSLDFKKDEYFLKKIKQEKNLSDSLLKIAIDIDKNTSFNFYGRMEEGTLNLNERLSSFNYDTEDTSFSIANTFVSSDTFEQASDSNFITTNFSKNIGESMSISYSSEVDLEQNFKPYSQNYEFNIFDECSRLKFGYNIDGYDDGGSFLTPNRTLTATYEMDYLGAFGYDSKGNYIFEPQGY